MQFSSIMRICVIISVIMLSLGRDPCRFDREDSGAINLGDTTINGESYFMPLSILADCVMQTTMTNYQALWTLHNLRYGVAETYSFTDIVTDVTASREANLCNYQLHHVSVDINASLVEKIRFYNETLEAMSTADQEAFLAQTIRAYPFHSGLVSLFNSLHDSHTYYSTPYEMFRIYFPVNFGSRMERGQQVVTLRYSTDSDHPIGRLAYVYQRVYGAVPLPSRYANSDTVVTHINGMSAIDFLTWLVSDEGPLTGMYQQLEQRLNGHIFSSELLVIALVLTPIPTFDQIVLRFSDGYQFEVKLIGQFSDLEMSSFHDTGDRRIMSVPGLSDYMHQNRGFDSFLSYEADIEEKRQTLSWLWSDSDDGGGMMVMPMERKSTSIWDWLSRKHKALVDAVANIKRDDVLNLPMLQVEEDGSVTIIDPRVDYSERRNADEVELAIARSLKLPRFLRNMFGRATTPSPSIEWVEVGGMQYTFVGDTVVVKIPSMVPKPRFAGDSNHYFFPDFVTVQKEARSRGVTRVLFDLVGNGGGYVMSAYALMWYTMHDLSQVCAPYRRRMTRNWQNWLDSFGNGIDHLVDAYLVPERTALADRATEIFREIAAIVEVLYEGLGFSYDDFGGVTKLVAQSRVKGAKARIDKLLGKTAKAAAIIKYIRERAFVPEEFNRKESLFPSKGYCPFEVAELSVPESGGVHFEPPLHPFRNPERKQWGRKAAYYSLPGEYSFCHKVLNDIPAIVPEYERGYWTQVAFVSDGTCGSACALFTQGIQTNGDAVAFTFGGRADTAMDVAAFAGGNVEEYDDFWPGIAFGARAGRLVSRGQAPYTKAHEKSWVSHPIAFPTKAKARFNWNMMFVKAMGENALPRQFYIIPGRKHFNRWGTDETSMSELYSEIVAEPNWASIRPQFAGTHGQCPKEVTPFAH